MEYIVILWGGGAVKTSDDFLLIRSVSAVVIKLYSTKHEKLDRNFEFAKNNNNERSGTHYPGGRSGTQVQNIFISR